jgi:hemerythrin-like domain-containing protein
MLSIADLMTHDHRACDDEFARIETAVAKLDWTAAALEQQRFAAALERHFSAEENQLFPAFEGATGMSGGPAAVMRVEHRQMRDLLDDLRDAIEACQEDAFRGSAETLLIMMQQHNMKEENILYPMCEDHLQSQAETLSKSLVESLERAHA